jgi:hypothetical protein
MPLPASIRSLKAQLRTLNEPDFWSSVMGLVLLMPLGWQIVNHLQQSPPETKTLKPQSDLDTAEASDPGSPTTNNVAAADIDNSAVLSQLLDGGVQAPSSVSALPASSPTTVNALGAGVVDRSASSQLDTDAVLDKFSGGSSAPATTAIPINPAIPTPSYTSRSIAQDILLAPYSANNYSANNYATPRSALQNALLENSAEREAIEAPSAPQSMNIEESIALVEPPSAPAPSTLELPTSTPVPLTPLPSVAPATSLLPLPTRALPAPSVEERIVPPTLNTLPPNLNTLPPNPNPIPTSTQQTKLYPYVPERVYSSPLPALPPSPTVTNVNNSGLPPLPNPGISPQSQNSPLNPTVAETIQPTVDSRVELEPVPFSVERSIEGDDIQTSTPAVDNRVELSPAPLTVERSIGSDDIQTGTPAVDNRVELRPAPFAVERLIGGGEINTFANP